MGSFSISSAIISSPTPPLTGLPEAANNKIHNYIIIIFTWTFLQSMWICVYSDLQTLKFSGTSSSISSSSKNGCWLVGSTGPSNIGWWPVVWGTPMKPYRYSHNLPNCPCTVLLCSATAANRMANKQTRSLVLISLLRRERLLRNRLCLARQQCLRPALTQRAVNRAGLSPKRLWIYC